MKNMTLVILAALLVLSAVGTAVAQETVDGGLAAAGAQSLGPSRFDLAAPWGVIDREDALPLVLATYKVPGTEAPWAWDLNRDGVINVVDLGMVAARQGCTVVDACYWR